MDKINSLPPDTDMGAWLEENPQYDPKKLKEMNQDILNLNWMEDMVTGESLLKKISDLGAPDQDDEDFIRIEQEF